jgi:hypothetical protein
MRSWLARQLEMEDKLDCLDQLELLNAKVWLDSRTGSADNEELQEMWQRLAALPPGVTNELRLLGMLDF